MPFYDRQCEACGWSAIDVFEPVEATAPQCPKCGSYMARAWLTKPPNTIGDEVDFIQHNGTKHPIRFRSKIEFRRWLKETGNRVSDSHIGLQGSDKSPYTTRHFAGGKDWLANAEHLAKTHHNGEFAGKEPDEPEFHVNWTSGELTPEQVAHYRERNRV